MHDSTVRQRKLRAQRKQAGWQQYELWLDPDAVALLDRLRQPGERLSDLVSRALRALGAQDAHEPAPMAGDRQVEAKNRDET